MELALDPGIPDVQTWEHPWEQWEGEVGLAVDFLAEGLGGPGWFPTEWEIGENFGLLDPFESLVGTFFGWGLV